MKCSDRPVSNLCKYMHTVSTAHQLPIAAVFHILSVLGSISIQLLSGAHMCICLHMSVHLVARCDLCQWFPPPKWPILCRVGR